MIAFDIETAPNESLLDTRQWREYKEKHDIADDQDAALHPAFSQVVCICAFDRQDGRKLNVCHDNEPELLREFSDFVPAQSILGGHYIKGFDLPYIANRCLANKLSIPEPLRVAGKKPWEIAHVDTVEILKFGNGPRISLDALCLMLGVPSPKEGDVNGLSVWHAFREKRFDLISAYCGRDVNAWIRCVKVLEGLGAC